MIGHDINIFDGPIDLTTDAKHLPDVIVTTVQEIQSRVKYFSATTCEIAVFFSPTLKSCFTNPLQGISFVQDNNIPNNMVFILCKSVGGWPVIGLILEGEQPELVIDAIRLQARIKVVEQND